MTDLNQRAAEIMGWRIKHAVFYYDDKGQTKYVMVDGIAGEYFNPTHNIEHAFMLVDWAREEKDNMLNLHTGWKSYPSNASFCHPLSSARGPFYTANTPAEAITKAFVEAFKESEDE